MAKPKVPSVFELGECSQLSERMIKSQEMFAQSYVAAMREWNKMGNVMLG